MRVWTSGTLDIEGIEVDYDVLHFTVGSHFGIDGGCISKLRVRIKGKRVIDYERGWGIRPKGQIEKLALREILKLYN